MTHLPRIPPQMARSTATAHLYYLHGSHNQNSQNPRQVKQEHVIGMPPSSYLQHHLLIATAMIPSKLRRNRWPLEDCHLAGDAGPSSNCDFNLACVEAGVEAWARQHLRWDLRRFISFWPCGSFYQVRLTGMVFWVTQLPNLVSWDKISIWNVCFQPQFPEHPFENTGDHQLLCNNNQIMFTDNTQMITV